MALADLLERLRLAEAQLQPGATAEALNDAREELVEAGWPPIPADYTALLAAADGIIHDEWVLAGTQAQPIAAGEYVPDIFDHTHRLIAEGRQALLGLGSGPQVWIAWDIGASAYVVVDQASHDVFAKFASIDQLVAWILDTGGLPGDDEADEGPVTVH